MIYYLHVPKTAGTSLRSLFVHNAGADGIAVPYLGPLNGNLDLKDLFLWPRERLDALKVIYGHYPCGIDRRLGRPGLYLTTLRETAPRLVSSYFEHARGGFVGDTPLLQYVDSWKLLDFDNYTVRLLSGVGHDVPFGGMTQAHLRLARDNLFNGFAAFGLMEDLARSVGLFCRVAKLTPVAVPHDNVAPPGQGMDNVSSDELAILVKRNELDSELYAAAREEYWHRWGTPAAPPGPRAFADPTTEARLNIE